MFKCIQLVRMVKMNFENFSALLFLTLDDRTLVTGIILKSNYEEAGS